MRRGVFMLIIHTDAAFDPKTGHAGLAFKIQEQSNIHQEKFHLDRVEDNHLAEFICFYLALKWLEDHQVPHESSVLLHTDSQIVAQSYDKKYVKSPIYQKVFDKALSLSDQRPLLFVKWVAEKNNLAADHLARQALKEQGSFVRWDDFQIFEN